MQKGGTTFLMSIFASLFCTASYGEPHFWADPCLAEAPASPRTRTRYLHCHFNFSLGYCARDQLQLIFEKSPALYTKPWAPTRIVETFMGSAMMPKIVVLLRNPTLRAWSGFIQCFPHVNFFGTNSTAKPFSLANVSLTHELFAHRSQLEMDIVNRCPTPVLGVGNFTTDYVSANAFSACCGAVAYKHQQYMWPGCRAYHSQRQCVSAAQLGLCRNHGNRWSQGAALSDYCFDFVRQGIYVQHLPAWYSSGLHIHLVLSEELFADPNSIAQQLMQLVQLPSRTIEKHLAIINQAHRTNTKAVGDLESMPEKTERALSRFFKPFNERLESTYLHRSAGWDTVSRDSHG